MSNEDNGREYDEFEMLDEILVERDKDGPGNFAKGYEAESPKIDTREVYGQNSMPCENLQNANDLTDFNIEECNHMLNLNRSLIQSLQELKKRMAAALQKCERKLSWIECNLKKNSTSEFRVVVCNAGMPYFKDKQYFCPPSNDDERLKASRLEIQAINLPRISSWTSKERNTLLHAIRDEAIEDIVEPSEVKNSDSTIVPEYLATLRTYKTKQKPAVVPKNIKELVGPLGSREFDWLKIAATHFEHKHLPMDCRIMWNVYLHPDINKSGWKKSEDNQLKQVVRQFKCQNWEEIAKELKTNRTAYQCFIRYNSTKKSPRIQSSTWTKKEDAKLLKLVEVFRIGDFIPWGEVATWMRNRTKQQVYFRWTYSTAPHITKGRFTEEEDITLKEAVATYGSNFRKISAIVMPNRSAIQLNDHYRRLIANERENSNFWTTEEDTKLIWFFGHVGPDWSRISKAFTNKTRTQVRHRYATLTKYSKDGVPIFSTQKEDSAFKLEVEEMHWKEAEEPKESNDAPKQAVEGFNDNVDKQLIEYFRMRRMVKESNRTAPRCDPEGLENTTKELYNILLLLNAKLDIPDHIEQLPLNDYLKQLLFSLKKHMKEKDAGHKNRRSIEEYELRMFGCKQENTTHFIPPLPFGIYKRAKKRQRGVGIEYVGIPRRNTQILENPEIVDTPALVVSMIGGEEQELQFQKLSRLLQLPSGRNVKQKVQKIYILSPQMLARKHCINMKLQNVDNDNIHKDTANGASANTSSWTTNEKDDHQLHKRKKSCDVFSVYGEEHRIANSLLEEAQYLPTDPYIDTTAETNEILAIEPAYATLASYKILMYLRRLFDNKHNMSTNLNESDHKLKEVQEACDLLETRMAQLFKYVIGLSKTITPEIHGANTFTNDDMIKKRKADKMLENRRKKILELADHDYVIRR